MRARGPLTALPLLVLLCTVPAGAAQPLLSDANPAPFARVPSLPDAIRLEFSETLDPAWTLVDVRDSHGTPLANPPRIPEGAPNALHVPLREGTRPGIHSVAWKTLSRDGGSATGEFVFTVGETIAAPTGIEAVRGAPGGQGTPLPALEAAAKALGYAGALAAAGLAAGALSAPAAARPRALVPAAGAAATLGAASGLILIRALAARLTIPTSDALATRAGSLYATGALLLLLAGAAFIAAALRTDRSRPLLIAGILGAVATLGIAIAASPAAARVDGRALALAVPTLWTISLVLAAAAAGIALARRSARSIGGPVVAAVLVAGFAFNASALLANLPPPQLTLEPSDLGYLALENETASYHVVLIFDGGTPRAGEPTNATLHAHPLAGRPTEENLTAALQLDDATLHLEPTGTAQWRGRVLFPDRGTERVGIRIGTETTTVHVEIE